MRFEARELKPYAEPLKNDDLEEGEVYFAVTFIDEDMLIPSLEPLVFVGRDFEAGETGKVYFQDLDSYQRGVRFDSASDEDAAVFQVGPAEDLNHVFDYEHALDVLLACSIRRRQRD